MRARNIKPGFFKNEDLAECSMAARLLFPGLWMLADREGRLKYRPKRWKGELFPYDNIDTAALFEELEANGLVKKYDSDGDTYVWIPKFIAHQNPHCKEPQSIIPAHPEDENGKKQEDTGECQHRASTVLARLIPDSPFLNPEEKALCEKQSESQPETESPSAPSGAERARKKFSQPDFDRFWEAFADKRGRTGAIKAWKAIRDMTPELVEQIVDGAKAYAVLRAGILARDGTPKMAQGWLAGRRWEDEIEDRKKPGEQKVCGLTF